MSCTFSTTAGPMRGDGVGVGLALDGAGVVGMAIVVVCGDDVARGGDPAHAEATTTTARAGDSLGLGCLRKGTPGSQRP